MTASQGPIARAELLPNGKWRGVATINGRRRTKTHDTEGIAVAWADTEMRRAARDEAAAAGQDAQRERGTGLTFAQYVPVFLNQRVLEPSTVTTYRSNLAGAIEEFGDRPLGSIDREDILTWITDMTRKRGSERATLGTIKARIKVVRMLFVEAVKSETINTDPTAGIRLPATPKMPFRIIEREEEDAFLAAMEHYGLLTPALLAIDAGLRWGETYGQHSSNVNLLRRTLTVSDVLARPDFDPRPYPKGKQVRTIPMTMRLAAALKDHLEDSGRTQMIRCPDRRCRAGALLFSHLGKTVNYHQWKLDFHRAIKMAGLQPPDPTFHKLRHTFGTRLAAGGVPAQEIATLMGHASTETTEIYVHAAAPSTREAWLRHALEDGPSPVASLAQNRLQSV